MKLLAIDCSAVAASVAVTENGKIISSAYSNVGLTHSQTLMPMLQHTLEQAHLSLGEIDYFAINAGPGSFTGVRIGVAALKGLTEFSEKNCIPVSTLASLAYRYKGVAEDLLVCAAMDARCNQVYTATFSVQGEQVTRLTEEEAVLIPDMEERLKNYKKPLVFVGDGATLCYNYYLEKLNRVSLAPAHLRFQNAESVAALAEDKIRAGEEPISSAELLPTYLRAPQAERELKKKQNQNPETGGIL